MDRETIARVAHEVNRAYCAAMGDLSQAGWNEAPDWQRESALAGVQALQDHPEATPEQMHEKWLARKAADGWRYGQTKDAEKKLHPCFLPYKELPPEQRAKDYLFSAVVRSLQDIQPSQVQDAAGPPPGTVPVRYIGKKPEWFDTLYGSDLYFTPGQVRPVPFTLAGKLLRHPDVFDRGEERQAPPDDTAALLAQAQSRREKVAEHDRAVQDLHFNIDRMDKASVIEFAYTQYRQKLSNRTNLSELRGAAKSMIDRFGLP